MVLDDANGIAGAGTMALEILRQVPDVDYLVVPVGGGGLLAGMALVAKELQPNIKVIAVEPEHAASLSAALEVGEPVHTNVIPTLADGLAVPRIGTNAFGLIQQHVDKVITVSEESIALVRHSFIFVRCDVMLTATANIIHFQVAHLHHKVHRPS